MNKYRNSVAAWTIAILVQFPGLSLGDVAESPDTTAEDLGGVVLLVSNVGVSLYLGHELKEGRTSTGRGFLGVGLGAGTVALGILEETSFSGAVGIAGAVTLALGIINLVGDGPPQEEDDQNFDLSRSISVSPLIVQAGGEQTGYGFLMSASF